MSFSNRHNFLNKSLAHLLLGLFWLLLLLYFLISFYLCTEKLLIFESQSCIQEHFCSLINKSLWMSFDFFLHSIILPEHKVFAAFIFLHFSPFVLSYCKNLQCNMYSTWPYIHNHLSLYFDKVASKILLLTMEFTIDFLLNILYKVRAISFYFLFTKTLFLKS